MSVPRENGRMKLDAFQQWMVARNLEYVETEGLEAVLDRLRAQGYNRVADAVEIEATKS